MLRALDLRVDVVVAEIPVLVRADDLTAERAENLLATLEPSHAPSLCPSVSSWATERSILIEEHPGG